MTGRGLGDVPDDDANLADLRWHWDLAYEINVANGTWTARFLPGQDVLSADSADQLRLLIRADYAARKAAGAAVGGAGASSEDGLGPGERALQRLWDEGVI